MRRIDRYVWRELAGAFIAATLVLLMVSFSGLFADMLSKIARGKVPAALLMSQVGLRSVDILPLLLPLSLFLGMLLGLGRLYRDSEMAVLASVGLGIRDLRRPVLLLALPVAIVVGMASLWLSPMAQRAASRMIDEANKSLLVAGLEPGRFVELPGRESVIYLSEMSDDGSEFRRLFVASERDGRLDVVTARTGELFLEPQSDERYLTLTDGFRVEGDPDQLDFRMMRFARNDIRVPDSERAQVGRPESQRSIPVLVREGDPASLAELHWRLASPLAALVLCLLALPLAKTPPRAARYGGLLIGLLSYIVYLNVLNIGRALLAAGTLPGWLGLWWAHALVAVLALWLLRRQAGANRRIASLGGLRRRLKGASA
jgi:lipopolysaccharide export system permease protein